MEEHKQKRIFMTALAALAVILMVCVYGDSEVKGEEPRQGTAYFIQGNACPGMTLKVGSLDGFGMSVPKYTWRVGEEILPHTDVSYTPVEADLEKMISVTIAADGYEDQILYACCSRLPVLYLNMEGMEDEDFQEQYKSAAYVLQGTDDADGAVYLEGSAQVKGRGNSSSLYPKKSSSDLYKLPRQNPLSDHNP